MKAPYLMGKSMVSCRFSLKPIHWFIDRLTFVKSDGAGMSCFVSPLHRGKSQISRGRRTGAVRRLKGSWGELLLTSLVGGLEHGFYDFPYIGNVIIPTDELIFFRGVGIPATTSSPFLPCWTVCPPCPCPFYAEVLPWIDVAVQISQLVQTGSPMMQQPSSPYRILLIKIPR